MKAAIRERSFLLLPPILTCVTFGCFESEKDNHYEQERQTMVDVQIKMRGIKDARVLDAMRKTPRHLFIPESQRHYAYADSPLPIGHEQTISQPYIVALMTELLDLKAHEKVLEIGTGSGYQAAILSHLCENVYTIELVDELGAKAKKLLVSLGYDNVNVKIGDGYRGWAEKALFDAIIVTCAPTQIPSPLVEQLAEGGRMVIPVGAYSQELFLLVKRNGKLEKQAVIPVRFVPMVDSRKRVY